MVAEDADALTAVPGIGKRSAQKLMLELRPKLELPDAELVSRTCDGSTMVAARCGDTTTIALRLSQA